MFAATNTTNQNPEVGIALLIGLCCIGSLFYFIPSIVAWNRGHQNTAAIVVLNLLLGWSFIGWVVALVWSFTEVKRRRRYHSSPEPEWE